MPTTPVPEPRWIDADEFKQWARNDIVKDDDLVLRAIAAAEDLLDDEAGRALRIVTDSTDASARSFTPDGTSALRIPDAAEITSVVENGTTLVDGTDYRPDPTDHADPTTLAWRPYSELIRFDRGWYRNGERLTVTVTAKWGWLEDEFPALIVQGGYVLAADWLEHRNVRLGVQARVGEDGFSVGIRSNPAVRRAIGVIKGPARKHGFA